MCINLINRSLINTFHRLGYSVIYVPKVEQYIQWLSADETPIRYACGDFYITADGFIVISPSAKLYDLKNRILSVLTKIAVQNHSQRYKTMQ